ncbi:hypothetical protein ACHAPU_002358 [Fusarium lateritium]
MSTSITTRIRRGTEALPWDVQVMIIDLLVDMHRHPTDSKIRLSPFASVCKSWRVAIEKNLFRNLILKPQNIHHFTLYDIPGRRQHIKHILLQTFCYNIDDTKSLDANLFTDALQDLLRVLSTWTGHRVTLELGAVSAYEENVVSVNEAGICTPIWARPGKNPPRDKPLPRAQLLRSVDIEPQDVSMDLWHQQKRWLMGSVPLELSETTLIKAWNPPNRCFKVDAVSELLILLRHFLNFSPLALTNIMSTMPSLESLRIERWCYVDRQDEKRWREEFQLSWFELPTSLKRFSVFQDNRVVNYNVWVPTMSNRRLRQALMKTAPHLEHLPVAFTLNTFQLIGKMRAHDFRALETVALTSNILLTRDRVSINYLLLRAAKAALKMPKLKIMELWCYSYSTMVVFRYERLGRFFGVITWEGYEEYCITTKVVDAWRRVLPHDDEDPSELQVETVALRPPKNFNMGSMYEYLKLREHIVHESTWAEVRV